MIFMLFFKVWVIMEKLTSHERFHRFLNVGKRTCKKVTYSNKRMEFSSWYINNTYDDEIIFHYLAMSRMFV